MKNITNENKGFKINKHSDRLVLNKLDLDFDNNDTIDFEMVNKSNEVKRDLESHFKTPRAIRLAKKGIISFESNIKKHKDTLKNKPLHIKDGKKEVIRQVTRIITNDNNEKEITIVKQKKIVDTLDALTTLNHVVETESILASNVDEMDTFIKALILSTINNDIVERVPTIKVWDNSNIKLFNSNGYMVRSLITRDNILINKREKS